MIYVGIDVAKDKHDCCILGPEADNLYPVFTIPNNKAGFDELYRSITIIKIFKSWLKYYTEEDLKIKVPECTICQNIYEDTMKRFL